MIGANYTIQLEEECDQDRACLRIVAIRAYLFHHCGLIWEWQHVGFSLAIDSSLDG